MATHCIICKIPAEIRDTVQCSICTHRLHFDCSGLSEKLYQLLTAEKKKHWKCRTCVTQKSINESTKTQLNATLQQNVTIRKKKTTPKKTTSFVPSETPSNMDSTHSKTVVGNSYSLDSSLLSDGNTRYECSPPGQLSNSMEERSCISSTQDLQHRITTLTSELMTTQNELENTIIENNELKRTVDKLTQEVGILKTLCTSPPLMAQNSSTPRKNRISNISHRSKTPQHPASARDYNLEIEKIKLEKQILDLQEQLSQANKDIIELKNLMNNLELKLIENSNNSTLPKPTRTVNSQTRNKICVISTNRRNKILNIAENTFEQEKYDLCHYLMPNRDIKNLLKDIELKIVDYTINDFCIILLGEDDFNSSNNYRELVLSIRTTLQRIQSTNILICLPTFICASNANVFNWRVENFNKLLNDDVIKYEYAYLIDSNRNLKYDETTFHPRRGTIKNFGMRVMFEDIFKKIVEIKDWNYNIDTDIDNYVNNNSQSFFRPSTIR